MQRRCTLTNDNDNNREQKEVVRLLHRLGERIRLDSWSCYGRCEKINSNDDEDKLDVGDDITLVHITTLSYTGINKNTKNIFTYFPSSLFFFFK